MSTVAASNIAPAPAGIESAPAPLEGQALNDAIIFQVEYYLSRENLSRDAYLTSQMDEEQYVKIDVLAQFKKLKTMSSDVEVIAAALRNSRLVELDASGQRVKPRPRPQRNTIILREIPSSASKESVLALFNGEGAPKVVEVRAEVGDNWFVVLENEEMALNALNWLRGQTYMDEPVRARMKSESTMLRSYFTGGAGGGPRQPVVPFIPSGQQVPYYGAPTMYNNSNNWGEFTPGQQPQQQQQQQQGHPGQHQQQHYQQGQNNNGRYQSNKYEGRRGDRGDRREYRRKSSPTRGGVMVSNGGGKGKKKNASSQQPQQAARPAPEPELTMAQFPPLHNDGSAAASSVSTLAAPAVSAAPVEPSAAAGTTAAGPAASTGGRPGGYGSRKIVRHSPEYIARIAAQSGAGAERPSTLATRLEGLTSGPLLPVDASPLEGLVGITSHPLAVEAKPHAAAPSASKQVWGPNAKEAIAAAAQKAKTRPATATSAPASPQKKAAAKAVAAPVKKEEKRPAAPAPEAAPATKAPAGAAPGPKSWAQIAKKTAQPKKR